MINYLEKYLKYKNKYNIIKKKLVGGIVNIMMNEIDIDITTIFV